MTSVDLAQARAGRRVDTSTRRLATAHAVSDTTATALLVGGVTTRWRSGGAEAQVSKVMDSRDRPSAFMAAVRAFGVTAALGIRRIEVGPLGLQATGPRGGRHALCSPCVSIVWGMRATLRRSQAA